MGYRDGLERMELWRHGKAYAILESSRTAQGMSMTKATNHHRLPEEP